MVLVRKATILLYFVLTTGECNLCCNYCGGSFPREKVPWEKTYDLKLLGRLLEDDDDATIAFYGGEPLLNSRLVEEIMDNVRARRFVIQTNGTLFERMREDYWMRMDAILLSIDGPQQITDHYRGNGVYAKVTRSSRKLRELDYQGDLIARMAVSERSDIYDDVMHLLNLNIFDHIHWQLDVGWSDRWVDFGGWLKESYEPGIRRLLERWVDGMAEGKVLGLVPFLGILKRIERGGPIPPCGSGSESYSILPDGRILACPISFDTNWSFLGRLADSRKVLPKVSIQGECLGCDYLQWCGGRCLYFNRERLWEEVGFRQVCEASKLTIDAVRSQLMAIRSMVQQNRIDPALLNYPKFNNSTEIIP